MRYAAHGRRVRRLLLPLLLLFICVAAADGSSRTAVPTLTRQPYLSDATPDSVEVNWATDRSIQRAFLSWGRAGGSCAEHSAVATGTAIVVDTRRESQWRARMSHLNRGSSYCYLVHIDDAEAPSSSRPGAFVAGLAAPDTRFRFAVVGDSGAVTASGENPDQSRLFAQMAATGARFALFTGDVPYGSGKGSTQDAYGDVLSSPSAMFGPASWPVAGRSLPMFLALGNHGLTDSFLADWPEAAVTASSRGRYQMDDYGGVDGIATTSPSAWYAFDAGGARFYVLDAAWADKIEGSSASAYQLDYDYHWDTTKGGCRPLPCGVEYSWLTHDLSLHRAQLKFAVFHFPLHSDNADEPSDPYLDGPHRLEGLLARGGVKIVFNGHAHMYERNGPIDGMISYVTGGGGAHLQAPTACSSFDRYAIGWSYSRNVGRSCHAPQPPSIDHVFHFLAVTVDGNTVTVTPTDELGRTFDVKTFRFASR